MEHVVTATWITYAFLVIVGLFTALIATGTEERWTNGSKRAFLLTIFAAATGWIWLPWLILGLINVWDWNINMVNNRDGRTIVQPADSRTLKAPVLLEKP